jgi:hypothetical protein
MYLFVWCLCITCVLRDIVYIIGHISILFLWYRNDGERGDISSVVDYSDVMIKEIASPPAADRNDYKIKKAGRARLFYG